MAVQGFTLKNGFISLIQGFNVSMTGYEGEASTMVTTLINRGGVVSVTSTTVLVFFALWDLQVLSVFLVC